MNLYSINLDKISDDGELKKRSYITAFKSWS